MRYDRHIARSIRNPDKNVLQLNEIIKLFDALMDDIVYR